MDKFVSEYNKNRNDKEFLTNLKNFSFFMNGFGSLKYKMIRQSNDSTMKFIIKELEKIPKIENEEILYNESFTESFYRIFWDLLSKLGVGTQNFYDFIEALIFQLNRFTTKDYIIYDCHSTDKYNCGRAMSIINKHPSQFLIYNTDDKGYMDVNTQMMYLSCENLGDAGKRGKVDIKIIEKYYGRFAKRILKEINGFKDFQIKMEETNKGIMLYLSNLKDKNLIRLLIPFDYPSSAPSGTFNDLTISEIDIDWNPNSSLREIVNRLLAKQKKNEFPKHKLLMCYLLDL